MFGRKKKRNPVQAIGDVEVWGDAKGVIVYLNGTPDIIKTLSFREAYEMSTLLYRAAIKGLARD